MMNAKIIKTDLDYQQALARLSALMDAEYGSPEGEELELLSFLLEKYEKEHFPIDLPDPIEAIKFRMDQQGLTRKDLEAYIGTQSKVSEVLNRKRPLSLAMIRALHDGLGIPAEVLLQEPGKELEECEYNYRDYPFNEMYRDGYFHPFNGTLAQANEYSEELLRLLFANSQNTTQRRIYCRNSDQQVDEKALAAWQARVLNLAIDQDLPAYAHEKITTEFMREVVRLSYFSKGPLLAIEYLNKRGIHVIVQAHLPHTYLDGACFKSPSGRPIIGITLRHDRLDHFWFTLLHELAHINLHLGNHDLAFFDDTEDKVTHSAAPEEIEANDLTADSLIPNEMWEQEKKGLLNTNRVTKIKEFADTLEISPAIVAGRMRWEKDDYTIFPDLIGNKAVRKLFFPNN